MNALAIIGIILASLAGLALIIILWGIAIYNNLIRLRNSAEEGFSTMDVYMKKRYDLIPNYVETVKGYAKHEKEALTSIINARNAAMTATDPNKKMANENAISSSLKSLFALSESYPELKANTNFMKLQGQLESIEIDIANARKYYNATVKDLNTKIEIFPSNIIAKRYKFEKKVMFEVSGPKERDNVKVEF